MDRMAWPDWLRDESKARHMGQTIASHLQNEFVFDGVTRTHSSGTCTPLLRHIGSDMAFCLLPGGSFRMGLSDDEERSARAIDEDFSDGFDISAMQPMRVVAVKPFLISQSIVPGEAAKRALSITPGDPRDGLPGFPFARLRRVDALALCEKWLLELPTEAQLEYAYRGGTQTLFPWGNTLPEAEALEGHVSAKEDGPWRNAFGLIDTNWGEWCRGRFSDADGTHDYCKDNNGIAVRGGAADGWPWQGCGEWIMLMSAHRYEITEKSDASQTRLTKQFRLARNIDEAP